MQRNDQEIDERTLVLLYGETMNLPPRAVARYIRLDDKVVEPLHPTEWDDEAYHYLQSMEENFIDSQFPKFDLFFECVGPAVGAANWESHLERGFESYLDDLKAWVIGCSPNHLMGHVLRDLELIKLGFKAAILLENRGTLFHWKEIPPSATDEFELIRTESRKSRDTWIRFLIVAILAFTIHLIEDISRLAAHLHRIEQNDYYHSIGSRANFTAKIDKRIDKDKALAESKPVNTCIYYLKRGGYRTPEIAKRLPAMGLPSLSDEATQKRYERQCQQLGEKLP